MIFQDHRTKKNEKNVPVKLGLTSEIQSNQILLQYDTYFCATYNCAWIIEMQAKVDLFVGRISNKDSLK